LEKETLMKFPVRETFGGSKMYDHPEFASKRLAWQYVVKVMGHTVHFDTGQCGDHAVGSREYFKTPDAPLNEYGFPTDKHSTISKVGKKVGKKWLITDFTKVN
jgi:hypothetical protein